MTREQFKRGAVIKPDLAEPSNFLFLVMDELKEQNLFPPKVRQSVNGDQPETVVTFFVPIVCVNSVEAAKSALRASQPPHSVMVPVTMTNGLDVLHSVVEQLEVDQGPPHPGKSFFA
jgi:hypothetical protein